ncbi:hypothetical protein [Krasilnikovia sp. MM14-A1259]|uniref:hypothetical protein n=1 Tax=Krasilnikovia sp. MM14-A1259 TaxID=3373539 RepID=UPI0038120153
MPTPRTHRRTATACALIGLTISAMAGLSACGDGGPEILPSARPSPRSTTPAEGEAEAIPTATRPTRSEEPSRTREPEATTAATTTPPATRTPGTPTTTTRTARPPTSVPATPTVTTTAAATTPPPETTAAPTTTPAQTPTATPSPAAATESGAGPLFWLVLIALITAGIVGGVLVYRARRTSAWDAEAKALEAETGGLVAMRLPAVLATTDVGARGLAWPPVRADLAALIARWNLLTGQAVGQPRQGWSAQIAGLLNELVTALDAENEAMAGGSDWTVLRTRVDRAEQALRAVLQQPPDQPGAGGSGPPPPQPGGGASGPPPGPSGPGGSGPSAPGPPSGPGGSGPPPPA